MMIKVKDNSGQDTLPSSSLPSNLSPLGGSAGNILNELKPVAAKFLLSCVGIGFAASHVEAQEANQSTSSSQSELILGGDPDSEQLFRESFSKFDGAHRTTAGDSGSPMYNSDGRVVGFWANGRFYPMVDETPAAQNETLPPVPGPVSLAMTAIAIAALIYHRFKDRVSSSFSRLLVAAEETDKEPNPYEPPRTIDEDFR